ncbi:MAG: hypothetical protein CMI55_00480 [Parcubacteria group bacterium]|jgi:hypothetical protein|nr:hypothetical protein [Parcubacteria group bacterium]|tara:strand:+ start:9340 stop:10668 length:1329 start_codon:yes stop_codon:yes gene_type:complete
MKESNTIKILISFSIILVLIGGFLIWQKGWILNQTQEISYWKLIPKLTGLGQEKTYLLLLQNNLELRPSGGYLGSFAIIKVKNGQVTFFQIHDTNIFDGFGSVQTDPPQPIKDHLKVNNWQMRDGNWSPDFIISAQQVEYFYHLQGGLEEFDGIIGINASILPELLKLTGPIYLTEFDKEFQAEDALYQLEYEVEQGYLERGLVRGERKTILKALGQEILTRLAKDSFWEQRKIKDLALKELNRKNILLYFQDEEVQRIISAQGWAGQVNQTYQADYLMIVEANLAARKSNFFITRQVEYELDLDKERPEATLRIIYTHTGGAKDWFNDDYRAYLRIYAPQGSWLLQANGLEDMTAFIDELGKTVFGNWIKIPTGQQKVIEFKYLLPEISEKVKQNGTYKLLVQKQIGVDSLSFRFVTKNNQKEYIKEKIIERDWEVIDILE